MNSYKKKFQEILEPIYAQKSKSEFLQNDVDYLTNAYGKIEEFWWENFHEIKNVKLILLGEAPLFGKCESYIYNPNIDPTSFLFKSNVSELWKCKNRSVKINTKGEQLENMRELGVIVVDMFPFAFCCRTAFKNKQLSPKNKECIIKKSMGFHIEPKLKEISCKLMKSHVVCVRYKQNIDDAAVLIPLLKKYNINDNLKEVGSNNMSIDCCKLKEAYCKLN